MAVDCMVAAMSLAMSIATALATSVIMLVVLRHACIRLLKTWLARSVLWVPVFVQHLALVSNLIEAQLPVDVQVGRP